MSRLDNTEAAPAAILSTCYDVIIVGAGVVGCAIARRFTLEGARVLVLEKSPDILEGASKGNSAILHTGFDAPPGSLEQECIATGYQEFRQINDKLGLPILECGALVVAWSSDDEAKLPGILSQAQANGVDDARLLSAAQLANKEPNLSASARAAIAIPREVVIDPWTTPLQYLQQALDNGATLLRGAEVSSGLYDAGRWALQTRRGKVMAYTVINCAGLYGDRLDSMLLGRQNFEIRPRKGQFLVFDKTAHRLIDSIILPVPGETTKGVVVCKTIFGNLLVGPTAEEQTSRDEAAVDSATLAALQQRAGEIIPLLRHCQVTASYAGIRPATEHKDYCIAAETGKNYISVGGIRSTGLSAALGIASHVYQLYGQAGVHHVAKDGYSWPAVSPIAEHLARDWSLPGNGGIVCHCELVTRREVERALQGPLAANSLSALKRRTRVTMGRCQGFYCTAALSELTEGRFCIPLGLEENEDG